MLCLASYLKNIYVIILRGFIMRYIALQVTLLLFIYGGLLSAQVIGQFPNMNGGFENETDTVLQNYPIPSGGSSSHWATTSSYGLNKVLRLNGRSGPSFLRIDLSTGSSKDIETPSVPGDGSGGGVSAIVNGINYTMQFYYRTSGTTKPASGKKIGIGLDGRNTINFDTVTFFATNGQWRKVSRTIMAGSTNVYPRHGIGLFRYMALDTVDIDIDDFVIYAAGKTDTIAPGSPTGAVIISAGKTSLSLQWSAPAAGIDTGGYVIVRGLSALTHQPNTNGIYAIGNEIYAGESVVYVGKDTLFSDTGLTAGATYYYKIFTVDKAYNYSEGVSVSGTTLPELLAVKVTLIPQGIYNSELHRLNLKDTVMVYLASSASPYEFVDSAKGFIDSLTFTAEAVFEKAPGGKYYIVAQHRSSVQTWSAEGIQFTKGDTVTYDFTTGAEKAFGNNLVLVDTKYCMFCGDVNQDGYVDPLDIALVDQDSYLYVVGHVVTDLNGDGYVDPLDISLADVNSYKYAGVKKPATAR
jgi:hypothetical protein